MNNSRVYLKICEGCGVLWLRTSVAAGVYCRGCSTKLAEFPPPNPGKCRNHRIRMAGERAARCRMPCKNSRPCSVTPITSQAAGGAA